MSVKCITIKTSIIVIMYLPTSTLSCFIGNNIMNFFLWLIYHNLLKTIAIIYLLSIDHNNII